MAFVSSAEGWARPASVRWLTTADVARMLDLTADGVRWLARARRLACETTVAGQRLFRPSDVQQFAERRMQARLTGLRGRHRRVGRLGEPRQLSLFAPRLQLIGGRARGERCT